MAFPILLDDNVGWGDTGTGSRDSGGVGSSSAPNPVPDEITDLVVDESGTLAVAYGKHVVRGTLILNKRTVGPPPTSVVIVALGEGVWDGIEAVYYAGEALPGTVVHFHPGTQSTGIGDPTQGVDSFYNTGL